MTQETKAILAILDMLEGLLPSHSTICDEIRYELTKQKPYPKPINLKTEDEEIQQLINAIPNKSFYYIKQLNKILDDRQDGSISDDKFRFLRKYYLLKELEYQSNFIYNPYPEHTMD